MSAEQDFARVLDSKVAADEARRLFEMAAILTTVAIERGNKAAAQIDEQTRSPGEDGTRKGEPRWLQARAVAKLTFRMSVVAFGTGVERCRAVGPKARDMVIACIAGVRATAEPARPVTIVERDPLQFLDGIQFPEMGKILIDRRKRLLTNLAVELAIEAFCGQTAMDTVRRCPAAVDWKEPRSAGIGGPQTQRLAGHAGQLAMSGDSHGVQRIGCPHDP